jgi:hypothetical protein
MVLSGILHARKRAKLEGSASALEGVLCGVLFAEGVLGAYYIAGHSMGSSAHSGGSRRSDGVLRGYSRWVLKGYGRALRRYSRSSLGVLEGFVRILRGSQRVLKRHFHWYSQGIPQKSGVLKGCS